MIPLRQNIMGMFKSCSEMPGYEIVSLIALMLKYGSRETTCDIIKQTNKMQLFCNIVNNDNNMSDDFLIIIIFICK